MKHLIKMIAILFVSTGLRAQTERIVFKAQLLYPEGVAWHREKNLFFISSVKTGTIGSVDESGMYKEIYKDKMLKSSFGMKIDEKNNRLLVCVSDPNYSEYSTPATFKKMARLISIDLNTGKKKWMLTLLNYIPENILLTTLH